MYMYMYVCMCLWSDDDVTWLLQVHVPPSLHRLNPVVILTASAQASLRTQTVHYNAIKMIR